MGAGRYLLWAGAAATAYVGYKLTVRTLALLFLDEKPFHWVASITPPPDYDAAADLAPGKAFIAQHHPELLHLVEQGSLSVLERPPGYDRAFPDQLFLLGTAHVSRKTAEAVYDTILKVEPDAVVVELC
ncbi:TraB domain-containing protein, partial [Haematococcus lacustris]